jgi:hypothetical protein
MQAGERRSQLNRFGSDLPTRIAIRVACSRYRLRSGRTPDAQRVCPQSLRVITSREPTALNAQQWLAVLRQYWGIENGVHQRIDASANEDGSRVRTVNAVWVMGMFRRLGVSIYAEWRSRSEKRRRASLHDFHNLMAHHNREHAYSLVSALSPSLNRGIIK